MLLKTMVVVCALCVMALPACAATGATGWIPPADSGVLNVRDFGAKGDGKADDTAAIQTALSKALDSHAIVYLPDGVYVVSDTLKWWRPKYAPDHTNGWGAFLQLQGQSQKGTIIRLAEKCDGFGDPEKPKAVIATGSRGYHGQKGYTIGEGNEAFENHIRDLTVEVGAGNPGAMGIDYQVSNSGAMRNVTIKAAGESGAIGIGLLRRDNGPGTISEVTIEGFDTAIATRQDLCQMNLQRVTLRGQRTVGIRNNDAVLNIHGLKSENAVPAVRNTGSGHLTLIDAELQGTGNAVENNQTPAAIELPDASAVTLLRDVKVTGYAAAILQGGELLKIKSPIKWWAAPADRVVGQPLLLPLESAPEVKLPPMEEWVFAGKPDGQDDMGKIEAALATGKPVVVLGLGRWRVPGSLVVPGHVKVILGLGAEVDALGSPEEPLFVVEGGKAGDVLLIDRLALGAHKTVAVSHRDGRTVVMRDLLFFSGRIYKSEPGVKKLFIDDVAGGGYDFAPGTRVWAEQWDTEGPTNTIAKGAVVWALGFKHEGGGLLFTVEPGGQLEAWGGLLYSFGGIKPDQPAIRFNDAKVSISLVNITFVGNGSYPVPISGGEKDQPVMLKREDLPGRGMGFALPLFGNR